MGLSERVNLVQGNAIDLPFAAESFEHAVMLHVGMNIEDKLSLFAQVHQSLKPGGTFALYDVMAFGTKPLQFPLPWATHAGMSFVATLDAYSHGLITVGFTLRGCENRSEFANALFAKAKAAAISR